MDKVRYSAVEMLVEIEKGGAYSTILFNKYVQKNNFSDQDRGLLTELVYGTLQRKLTIDEYLSDFVKKPQKVQPWVMNLLRISVYQKVYLDRIPDHAIIFESVEIAKKRGHQGVVKFVNGVLRSFQRAGLKDLTQIKPATKRISVMYSMPEWLVELLTDQFGIEQAETIAASVLTSASVSLRMQDPKADRDALIASLTEQGMEVVPSVVSPQGIRIISGSVMQTEEFQNGEVTIQDESSMLVAPVGNLTASDQVLDTCSAPGGKTTHMASFLDAEAGGKVVALDIHDHKISLVKQNAERLHVSDRVDARKLDARKASEVFGQEAFDAIYVDAPCSGLGLMRRKPDIKYTKKYQDIEQLHKIQVEILNSVAKMVKKGGRLIYSTCTLSNIENDLTVTDFLANHSEFKIDPISELDYLSESLQENGTIQILPNHYNTDGFYICRLVKK